MDSCDFMNDGQSVEGERVEFHQVGVQYVNYCALALLFNVGGDLHRCFEKGSEGCNLYQQLNKYVNLIRAAKGQRDSFVSKKSP